MNRFMTVVAWSLLIVGVKFPWQCWLLAGNLCT